MTKKKKAVDLKDCRNKQHFHRLLTVCCDNKAMIIHIGNLGLMIVSKDHQFVVCLILFSIRKKKTEMFLTVNNILLLNLIKYQCSS